MSYRALIILALVAACGDDSTTTTFGGSSSTGEPGTTDQSTASPTTNGPTSDPTGPSTATTSATTTSTSETTSTDTTSTPGTTTTTDGETTGPATSGPDTTGTTGNSGQCGVDGDSIVAELVHVGEMPPCGPLEFTGQLASNPKGPVWQLDGCACGANCLIPDPWTFTMTAPAQWLPTLPECPRIVVERQQMGFAGCEFAAVSIWDSQNPDQPAFYHAGHGFAATQAAAGELSLAEKSVGQCACDDCCTPPELFDIAVEHLGAKAIVAEGETVPVGKFTFANFESHSSGICDVAPDVHWALRQGM
jgi:hypothetical protein